MARRSNKSETHTKPRRPPASTLEGRENQMINLAVARAEQQLRDGTASAAVITHFLKLGATRERLEQEKLRQENRLLDARVDAIASAARMEEVYAQALSAMRRYQGEPIDDD